MKSKFLKTLKILLVEDEERLCSLLKNTIGKNFYSFVVANDGLDGLEKFKKMSPDIVITDIMMSKMNGLEMAKKIKEIDSNVPVIILSAFSDAEKFLEAIDIGVVKYFIKPFEPEELLDYIESLQGAIADKTVSLCDGFEFYKTSKSLYKDAKYIVLTKKETMFLQLLVEAYPNIVRYDTIKKSIWSESVSDERLRTFIRRFRDKTSKQLLQNIKAQGYRVVFDAGFQ